MSSFSSEAPARPFERVLIANRGEIALRVIRGSKDAGKSTVAVYADQDRDAPFVHAADDAFALGGTSSAETYLDIDKLIDACKKSGADAVHPGYGFLAESAEFAQAVIDAGIVWIGPPPKSIADLGAKTIARDAAVKVGAPLAPGLDTPATTAEEIEKFADENGLPVIIKAVYGGGGRGMKVIHERSEIKDAFESATSESMTAFGRNECFVERFLEHARHVETQCLADREGNVVVVSTRDCSLQRRNQKLVDEAPAPFLTDEQNKRLYDASKAIVKEIGYVNVGTCEFLVGADGLISFNEVNTRLQVEHPVTEQVTGFDLVREQIRIAEGGVIDYGDPEIKGHAIEFRINGEDPGRGFLPMPGPLTVLEPPSGPGVRWDGGFVEGDTVPGEFDSLLGKLIVYGADRKQAIERARRALAEFTVAGSATVLPFDREIVVNPDFVDGPPLGVHTRWNEDDYENNIAPFEIVVGGAEKAERESLVVEVNGRRVEVTLPAGIGSLGSGSNGARAAAPRKRGGAGAGKAAAAADGAIVSPMQAKVVRVAVEDGQDVAKGDTLIVIEAMKMEQSLVAERDGKVNGLTIAAGDSVSAGDVLCTIVAEG